MTAPFITSASDLSCIGWSQVGSIWITQLPLIDTSQSAFAELTYAGALLAARAFGARLPMHDEIALLNTAAAIRPAPFPLPTSEMSAGMSEAQVNAYRDANMGTVEWAKLHYDEVSKRIAALGWDGTQLVANAGKHWQAGAPAGRAWLMGWWVEAGTGYGLTAHFIQPGSSGQGPHDDGHHDYGTTTVLVRDSAP